jgi:hypothetical protein
MSKKVTSVIDAIKEAVSVIVEEKGLVTKDDLNYLPTRDEFNTRMDEVMGELKAIREEQSMLSQHSKDHSDVIEALQKIHPHNSHPSFA